MCVCVCVCVALLGLFFSHSLSSFAVKTPQKKGNRPEGKPLGRFHHLPFFLLIEKKYIKQSSSTVASYRGLSIDDAGDTKDARDAWDAQGTLRGCGSYRGLAFSIENARDARDALGMLGMLGMLRDSKGMWPLSRT